MHNWRLIDELFYEEPYCSGPPCGLSATTIGYAAEPAISTVNPSAVESTDETNDVAQDSANASQ